MFGASPVMLLVLSLPFLLFQGVFSAEPAVLDMANFRTEVEGHHLSYVFFYTKKGKGWEEALETFNKAAELMQDVHKGAVFCCTVDLDDNAPLTLYSKYNSLDLMIFYPDFVPTPLRFHGNYTAEGIVKSADRLVRYTHAKLLQYADPRKLVEEFMLIKFKGAELSTGRNLTDVLEEATFHSEKLNIFLEYLALVNKDFGDLVDISNTLRHKLHNSKHLEKLDPDTGTYKNELEFLDHKMRLGIADDFLRHMFPKKKFPTMGMKTSSFLQQEEEKRKVQIKLDAQARAAEADEELM